MSAQTHQGAMRLPGPSMPGLYHHARTAPPPRPRGITLGDAPGLDHAALLARFRADAPALRHQVQWQARAARNAALRAFGARCIRALLGPVN